MKTRILQFAVALLLLPALLQAQDQPNRDNLKLTASPAAVPQPALKHHFFPDVLDQVPGNAALQYLTAAQQLTAARAGKEKESDLIDQWLALKPSEIPFEKARELLQRHHAVLNYLRLASLRERCDFDPPYRTEGYRTLLPYLSDARQLARIAALQTRVYIASGEHDAAINTIAFSFIQAKHLTNESFLVQLLVSAAITNVALDQVAQIIAAPNSPNLYWALGELGAPFIDIRAGLKFERAGIYYSIPGLKHALTNQTNSPEYWAGIQLQIQRTMNDMGARQQNTGEAIMGALLAARDLPAAKKYLTDELKIPQARVDQFPSAQIVFMYQVHQFESHNQARDKWLTLPFPQAIAGLTQAEEQSNLAANRNAMGFFAQLVPVIRQSHITLTMVDRRIAALRTVEAVRAFAAANDSKLPASLTDIKETPAPLDPMTGRIFSYQVKGDSFIIEGESISDKPPKTAIRIEVQIKK